MENSAYNSCQERTNTIELPIHGTLVVGSSGPVADGPSGYTGSHYGGGGQNRMTVEGKLEKLSPVGSSETQVHVWGGRNVAHADADANHPSALAYEDDFRLLAD